MTKVQFAFFKLFSICGMICFLLISVAAISFQSGAQITPGSVSVMGGVSAKTVSGVEFPGGRFVDNGDGSWSEYAADGNFRYRFKELGRGDLAIKLRNEALNVNLVIDTQRRVVEGDWPGHPRSVIYDISHFQTHSTPTPPPPPPQPPVPDPVPPLPHPPSLGDVSPSILALVEHSTGRFEKDGSGQWTEFAQSGARFSFDSLGYDDRSVFLLDRSRNVFLEIDTRGRSVNMANGGVLSRLYTISGMSDQTRPPPPPRPQPPVPQPRPQPDGKMSVAERVLCMTHGGFVERAGMLGHERCTKPYSDGGMICSDNSQCQGKCIAPGNASNELVVSGTCQVNDNPFGCKAFVENGRATPALCTD